MAYTLISTTTVGAGGTQSVTFSNIPQTGTHLVIQASVRGEYAATNIPFMVRANNNSSGVYPYRNIQGTSSTYSSFGSSGNGTSVQAGFGGGNTYSSTYGLIEIFIPDYTRTTTGKNFVCTNSLMNQSTSAYDWFGYMNGAGFTPTGAITTLTCFSNYGDDLAENTKISLYSIS